MQRACESSSYIILLDCPLDWVRKGKRVELLASLSNETMPHFMKRTKMAAGHNQMLGVPRLVYHVLVFRLGVCRAPISAPGPHSFLKFFVACNPRGDSPPWPTPKRQPHKSTQPTGKWLTHISSTECFPQWPGSHVDSLPIHRECLHTALKASVCSCCSDQPVGTGSPTEIEGRPKGNFTVLAL